MEERSYKKVAVLYNAEGEWSGQCMRLDQVARPLYDAQIDFSFLPLDHLDRADKFIYVIVPYAKYQPIEIAGLSNVIYVDALPDAYTMGEDAMQKEAENKAKKADDLAGDAKVLALGDLVAHLEKRGYQRCCDRTGKSIYSYHALSDRLSYVYANQ